MVALKASRPGRCDRDVGAILLKCGLLVELSLSWVWQFLCPTKDERPYWRRFRSFGWEIEIRLLDLARLGCSQKSLKQYFLAAECWPFYQQSYRKMLPRLARHYFPNQGGVAIDMRQQQIRE